MAYDGSKCLGERFQDAFLEAWGNKRIVPYAKLPAHAQTKWNRAAVAFTASLSDAPKPSFRPSEEGKT